MVTKRDDDDDRRQGEYRAICLWKMDWQSFAKTQKCGSCIQYLAGKKQENFALSAFILEGNIG